MHTTFSLAVTICKQADPMGSTNNLSDACGAQKLNVFFKNFDWTTDVSPSGSVDNHSLV